MPDRPPSKMPIHRVCVPVDYTLLNHDPHRVLHRRTAHVERTVTFSIPPGPWRVFMFAALDAHGAMVEPFSLSWSSTPLVPQQWYAAPSHPSDLVITRGSSSPYEIIFLLVGSTTDSVPDRVSDAASKPLPH